MRVMEYMKALQPRRNIWFISGISGIGLYGLIAFGIAHAIPLTTTAFHVVATATALLMALLIVLFVSGYVAWDKERQKNEDEWPRLGASQRVIIADALKPFKAEPDISIFFFTDDAMTLAIDLCDVFTRATDGTGDFTAQKYPFPLASGLRIDASTDDARGPLIRKVLERELGIEVHLERRSPLGFLIMVGARA
jgi:hypothetical protein